MAKAGAVVREREITADSTRRLVMVGVGRGGAGRGEARGGGRAVEIMIDPTCIVIIKRANLLSWGRSRRRKKSIHELECLMFVLLR